MRWEDVHGYFIDVDKDDYRYLVSQVPNNGMIVEVGCFRGKSLASISDLIIAKKLYVWAVDIFDKIYVPEYIEEDVAKNREGMLDGFKRTIEYFGISQSIDILVSKSSDGAKECARLGYKPDLVFIDDNHSFEGATESINSWWPLIKFGGILSFHDYDHNGIKWPGVHKAIHEKFGQPYFGCFIASVRKTENGFNTIF